MLAGRDGERRRLADLLGAAGQGRSGVLLLRGEAGIGKSTLLDETVAAADGMTVLRVRGVESEAELPYAALHRLLRPALPALEILPPPQAGALRRALGMEPDRDTDRFLVSLAVLGLLDALGAGQPVLCVIDDAHWLDTASARALTFVARRLLAEAVVMIFAVRDPAARGFTADDLPQLAVTALDTAAAQQVLAAHTAGPVHPDVAERLTVATAGNPLALAELAGALDAAQLAGTEPLPVPLPLTAGVEQAFLDRVRRLPEHTQRLLLVAAAEETGRIATVLAAAAALGVQAGALGPAEKAGVVRAEGTRLDFRHPLVRSAVYHGATFTDRQAAHQALAGVLDQDRDADRRAWHRAAATVGPDGEVAQELDRAAGRARARGAFAAAAAALRRAAELSVEPGDQVRRLVGAGDNLWRDGRGEQAVPLLQRAREASGDPRWHSDIDRLLGLIHLGAGDAAAAYRILWTAARDAAVTDPLRALNLLLVAVDAAAFAADRDEMAALARLATSLQVVDGTRERFLVRFLAGLADQYAGREAAATGPLREALSLAGASSPAPAWVAEAPLLAAAHRAAFYLGDDAAERRLSADMVARAREAGDVGVLPLAGARQAISHLLAGQWVASEAVASEAVQLARATRQDDLARPALAHLGLLAALRGDASACRRHLDEAAAGPHRPMAVLDDAVRWSLSALDLARAAPQAALDRLAQIRHPMVRMMSALDRVEAAHQAGDRQRAAGWAQELSGYAERTGQPWAKARAAHAEGLADPSRFVVALEHHRAADRPFEQARTEYAYGAVLRRPGSAPPPGRTCGPRWTGSTRSAPPGGPLARRPSCGPAGRRSTAGSRAVRWTG
ncbi:ATP-binding protein [Actinoplanes sp. NBC_00393]|uniref:ATP-binding protein n=1 Tax=Actinoplanes sp. NBC_00393 TaxID=2975953 RepID=UPI002E1A27C9